MTGTVDERIRAVAAADRLLVALDFDGTLSPLVTEPMSSRATPEAKRAVERLASCPGVTVALVSGRSLADLRVIAEHDDASPVWLAGSHGAEAWRPPSAPPVAATTQDEGDDAVVHAAREAAAAFDGAWIEGKRFGFALHTRTSPEGVETRAQRAVDEVVARLAPEWRRREGKHVLEFSWRHEGKDGAVAELRAATGSDAVIFAGDDVTDEDALRSLGPSDLGIRVGPGETAATLTVTDTPELAAVLTRVADLRAS
ncbi:MAG TPA: trehalose-phosphatase [Candidatus Microbacterium stercoravium]|uniref:Trehalose 6-phosphate phosphatase n=1 Tax=Candidatus Microbacterium stercoravium TaxID=2838697 RepID=A0A9D2H3E7_9MICO|nr:trehalose-phosphatase [Candidatus Microbacterium stercoravium]